MRKNIWLKSIYVLILTIVLTMVFGAAVYADTSEETNLQTQIENSVSTTDTENSVAEVNESLNSSDGESSAEPASRETANSQEETQIFKPQQNNENASIEAAKKDEALTKDTEKQETVQEENTDTKENTQVSKEENKKDNNDSGKANKATESKAENTSGGIGYSVTVSCGDKNMNFNGGVQTPVKDILTQLGIEVREDSKIEIDKNSVDEKVIALVETDDGYAIKDLGRFSKADKNLILTIDGETVELELTDPTTVSGEVSAEELSSAFNTAGESFDVNIILSSDTVVTGSTSVVITDNVIIHNLYLNGNTLLGQNGSDSVFTISSGAVLYVYGGNLTETDGEGSIISKLSIFKVLDGGMLKICSGVFSSEEKTIESNKENASVSGGSFSDSPAEYVNGQIYETAQTGENIWTVSEKSYSSYMVDFTAEDGTIKSYEGGEKTELSRILKELGYDVKENSVISVVRNSIDENCYDITEENGILYFLDKGPFENASKNLELVLDGQNITLTVTDANKGNWSIYQTEPNTIYAACNGLTTAKLLNDFISDKIYTLRGYQNIVFVFNNDDGSSAGIHNGSVYLQLTGKNITYIFNDYHGDPRAAFINSAGLFSNQNNYTITCKGAINQIYGTISVGSNATVTLPANCIIDSIVNAGIVNLQSTYLSVENEGTLNIKAGTENRNNNSYIVNVFTGNIYMYGGTVNRIQQGNSGGSTTVNGGTVGELNIQYGSATINDGSINTINNGYDSYPGGTLNFKGGSLTYRINNKATLNITGGNFSGANDWAVLSNGTVDISNEVVIPKNVTGYSGIITVRGGAKCGLVGAEGAKVYIKDAGTKITDVYIGSASSGYYYISDSADISVSSASAGTILNLISTTDTNYAKVTLTRGTISQVIFTGRYNTFTYAGGTVTNKISVSNLCKVNIDTTGSFTGKLEVSSGGTVTLCSGEIKAPASIVANNLGILIIDVPSEKTLKINTTITVNKGAILAIKGGTVEGSAGISNFGSITIYRDAVVQISDTVTIENKSDGRISLEAGVKGSLGTLKIDEGITSYVYGDMDSYKCFKGNQVKSGYFEKKPINTIAEGFGAYRKDGIKNITYYVTELQAASIDDYGYETLTKAIENAPASQATTVKIEKNLSGEQVKIPANKIITIDLNGKSVVIESASTDVVAVEVQGTFILDDSSADKAGLLKAVCSSSAKSGIGILVTFGGKAVVANGLVEGSTYGIKVQKGTAEIKGGTVSNSSVTGTALYTLSGQKSDISGGKFYGTLVVESGGEINPTGGIYTDENVKSLLLTSTTHALTANKDPDTRGQYPYEIKGVDCKVVWGNVPFYFASYQDGIDKAATGTSESARTVVIMKTTDDDYAVVSVGQKVIIDLNGHNISNSSTGTTKKTIFTVNGGELKITDSNNTSKGSITSKDVEAFQISAADSQNRGKLTIDGISVIVTKSAVTSTDGDIILNNAKIILSGTAADSGDAVTLNGTSTLAMTSSEVTGIDNGIVNNGSGNVTISGNVTGNKANSISLSSSCTGKLSITSGIITGNISAVNNQGSCEIDISGGAKLTGKTGIITGGDRAFKISNTGSSVVIEGSENEGIQFLASFSGNATITSATINGKTSGIVNPGNGSIDITGGVVTGSGANGITNSGNGNLTVRGNISVNGIAAGIENSGSGSITITGTSDTEKAGIHASGDGSQALKLNEGSTGTVNITYAGLSGKLYGIYNLGSEDITLAGTILNVEAADNSVGIFNGSQSTGTLAVKSGSAINGNIAINNLGAVNIVINDSTTSIGNDGSTVKAVVNSGSGSVDMSGGTVQGTEKGIENSGTGNIRITGGTVKGVKTNTVTTAKTGTGIDLSGSGCQLTVSGATVEGGTNGIISSGKADITLSGVIVSGSDTASGTGISLTNTSIGTLSVLKKDSTNAKVEGGLNGILFAGNVEINLADTVISASGVGINNTSDSVNKMSLTNCTVGGQTAIYNGGTTVVTIDSSALGDSGSSANTLYGINNDNTSGKVVFNSGTICAFKADGTGIINKGTLEVNGGISTGTANKTNITGNLDGIRNLSGTADINGGIITGTTGNGLTIIGGNVTVYGSETDTVITGGKNGIEISKTTEAESKLLVAGGDICGNEVGLYVTGGTSDIAAGKITAGSKSGTTYTKPVVKIQVDATVTDNLVSISGGTFNGSLTSVTSTNNMTITGGKFSEIENKSTTTNTQNAGSQGGNTDGAQNTAVNDPNDQNGDDGSGDDDPEPEPQYNRISRYIKDDDHYLVYGTDDVSVPYREVRAGYIDPDTKEFVPYVAKVTISGTDNWYKTIEEAIADAGSNTVELVSDLNLNAEGQNTITVTNSLTLNLNGHTISAANKPAVIVDGGSLVIEDTKPGKLGKISATGTGTNAIEVKAAGSLTVSGGTIEGENNGISSTDCSVTVSGGKIIGKNGSAVAMNGTETPAAVLSVTGGELEGKTAGISVSGNIGVTASGGTVSGENCGISNSGSGAVNLSGTASVSGTGENGVGIVNSDSGALTISATTAGDKVSVYGKKDGIQNSGVGDITVGNTSEIIGETGYGISLEADSNGKLSVTGGNISGKLGGIINNSTVYNRTDPIISITGGTISSSDGSGIETVSESKGLVSITAGNISGKTGITNNGSNPVNICGSADISGTVAGIANGSASSLNISGGAVSGPKGISNSGTFNISGGTVTGSEFCGVEAISGTVTVSGSASVIGAQNGIDFKKGALTVSNGTVTGTSGSGIETDQSSTSSDTVTVSGGKVYGITGITNNGAASVTVSGGTVGNDGTYTSAVNGIVNNGSGSVTVSGGTVKGTDTGITNTNNGTIKISGTGNISSTDGSGIKMSESSTGTLTVEGTTSKVEGKYAGIDNFGKGNITISGGTVNATDTADGIGIINESGSSGTLAISGTSAVSGTTAILNNGNVEINVSGGTVGNSGTKKGIVNNSTKDVNISGGTVTGSDKAVENNSSGNVAVSGGTVGGSNTVTGIENNGTGTVTVSGDETSHGSVIAKTTGILNKSSGNIIVSGTGNVEATAGNGIILASTSTGDVTVSGGSVKGSTDGIQNNSTSDETKITVSGGAVEGTAGSGINNTENSKGTLNVTGGGISGKTGITSNGSTTTNISGGTVTGTETGLVNSSGTANISGGTISGPVGIQNSAAGELNISGGDITGTSSNAINITGGAVSITGTGDIGIKGAADGINITGGTLDVTGGKIAGTSGSGINIPSGNGTVTVSNASSAVIPQISGKTGITNSGTQPLALNGGNISGTDNGVVNTGALTVSGCTITGGNGSGIDNSGDLTVNSGTISGTENGIINKADAKLVVNNGTVTGTGDASNGIKNLSENGLTVNDGNISGKATGITSSTGLVDINGGDIGCDKTNGTAAVQISGGKAQLSGTSSNPANLTGKNGLQVTGGEALIENGTKIDVSGNAVDAEGGTTYVNGGDIKGTDASLNQSGSGKINVYNGNFSGPTKATTPVNLGIDGGAFDQKPALDEDIYNVYKGSDGKWHVECKFETRIESGGTITYYETVEQALENANPGETITFTKNVERTVTVPQGKQLTLDLNGKQITSKDGPGLVISGNATVTDSSALQNGKISGTPTGIEVTPNGTLTLDKGEVSGTDEGILSDGGAVVVNGGNIKGNSAVSAVNGATLTVNGGKIEGTEYGIYSDSSTLDIKGGEISGKTGIYSANSNVVVNGTDASVIGTLHNGITAEGGGVEVKAGKVEGKTNGIEGNNGAKISVSGGTVEGREKDGVSAADSSVSLTGGKVTGSENGVNVTNGEASISGTANISGKQGLRLADGSAKISGGTITGTDGNGIEVSNGKIEMSAGKVTGSKDGIKASRSEIDISGGEINGTSGKGVDLSGGSIRVATGTISGGMTGINADADDSGSPSTVQIISGDISGTKSGIEVHGGSSLAVKNGKISAAAGDSTAAVVVDESRAIFNGGTVAGNLNMIGKDANTMIFGGTFEGLVLLDQNLPTLTVTGGSFADSEAQKIVKTKLLDENTTMNDQGIVSCPYSVIIERESGLKGANSISEAISEIAEGEESTIILIKSSSESSVNIGTGENISVDLNGWDINNTAITVDGGKFTLSDSLGVGKVTGVTTAITVKNSGELVINSGNVVGAADQTVLVSDSTVTVNGGKIYNASNGIKSQNSSVTVNGGEITGSSSGIYSTSGDVTVTAGTVTSSTQAICGEDSSVTVSGGNISGDSTAISVSVTDKGSGSLEISGGDIASQAQDGVAVTTTGIDTNISGGTFNAANLLSVTEGNVIISGGDFTGKLPQLEEDSSLVIRGGTFTEDPSEFVPAGYKVEKNPAGKYVVSKIPEDNPGGGSTSDVDVEIITVDLLNDAQKESLRKLTSDGKTKIVAIFRAYLSVQGIYQSDSRFNIRVKTYLFEGYKANELRVWRLHEDGTLEEVSFIINDMGEIIIENGELGLYVISYTSP